MHRMRRFFALTGLALAAWTLAGGSASADISSTVPQTYPDIIANLGKGVSYTYDPGSQNGVFHLKNTAYVLVTGPSASDEYDISPTADGSRYQLMNVTLDQNGKYVNDPGNLYQVYGSVTANGQTYSGLLLSGKPIDFQTSTAGGVTQFQTDLQLDGTGLLAKMFGENPYIHMIAEAGNGFTGSYSDDFSISKVSTNTHGPDANGQPFPVPEPTSMMVLALGGLGIVYRNRRRLARA